MTKLLILSEIKQTLVSILSPLLCMAKEISVSAKYLANCSLPHWDIGYPKQLGKLG